MQYEGSSDSHWSEDPEGVPVLRCFPGSPSERAGIRPNDIVIALNGQRVCNVGDYLRAQKLRSDGMDVVVRRDWQELEFEVKYGEPLTLEQTGELFGELIDPQDPDE